MSAQRSERTLTDAGSGVNCSARNRFEGTVKSVVPGAVNAEIVVTLPSGLDVAAVVTNESVMTLELAEGRPATVLVKASSVLIAVGEMVVCSARNRFAGTVTAVRDGAVNGEVRLRLSGGEEVTSTITSGSIQRLGLKPGIEATAMVKASSVLLAVR